MPSLGRRGVFKLDDSLGTLTDISNKLTDVNINDTAEKIDTTTFHPTNIRKSFLPGWVEGTIDLAGMWDATIAAHLNSVLAQDTPLQFEYGPVGEVAGAFQRTGTAVLLSAPTTQNVNGVILFTAQLALTGAVTDATYPT